MKIGFAVVGHIKREEDAKALAAKIDCKLYLDDGSFGEWANHERAWRYLAEEFDYGVVLQDDCLPVDNFVVEACAAIKSRPDEAISFYTGTTSPVYVQTRVKKAIRLAEAEGLSWLRSARMFWGPCVGLPSAIVNDMLNEHGKDLYDEHIGNWCMRHRVRVSYTYPSLVEHADGFSVVANSMPTVPRVAHKVGHQIDPTDTREATFWMAGQR